MFQRSGVFRQSIGFFLVWAGLFLVSCGAFADENTGFEKIIKLDEIFAQVQGQAVEENVGGLSPLSWKLGVLAQPTNWLDISTSVGASQLLYLPAWSQATPDSIELLDFKAEVYSDYGTFYAGQFLIPWGLEGTTEEADLWLPRSLFYEKGVLPLRDLGGGFQTDYDGYYMNLAAHNGLGGGEINTTGRMFLTGQWGYHGPLHSSVGFSATVGHIAYPILPQETKVRGLNAFYGFNIFGLGLQLEASCVEMRSDSMVTDSLSWHSDVQHPFSDHVNLIGRYEAYNPNLRVSSDVANRIYLGGEYHSLDNISRLFVFAVKNMESQGGILPAMKFKLLGGSLQNFRLLIL